MLQVTKLYKQKQKLWFCALNTGKHTHPACNAAYSESRLSPFKLFSVYLPPTIPLSHLGFTVKPGVQLSACSSHSLNACIPNKQTNKQTKNPPPPPPTPHTQNIFFFSRAVQKIVSSNIILKGLPFKENNKMTITTTNL